MLSCQKEGDHHPDDTQRQRHHDDDRLYERLVKNGKDDEHQDDRKPQRRTECLVRLDHLFGKSGELVGYALWQKFVYTLFGVVDRTSKIKSEQVRVDRHLTLSVVVVDRCK